MARYGAPMRLLSLLLVFALAGPARAVSLFIAAPPVSPQLTAAEAQTVSRLVETQVRTRLAEATVVTAASVNRSLELAALSSCLGGDDGSCVSELAGALGVDYIVTSHLGRVGDISLVTVSIYQAERSSVVAQASRQLRDKSAVLGALPALVDQALSEAGLMEATPASGWVPLAALGAGGAGFILLAGGAALTHLWVWLNMAKPYRDGLLTRDEAARWEKNRAAWWALPSLGYAAGALALAAGGVGYALSE